MTDKLVPVDTRVCPDCAGPSGGHFSGCPQHPLEYLRNHTAPVQPSSADQTADTGTTQHGELVKRLRLGASISRDRGINLDFAAIADEAAAALERGEGVEAVAWMIELADSQYPVDSLDDPQAVDDLTNANAVATPLYR